MYLIMGQHPVEGGPIRSEPSIIFLVLELTAFFEPAMASRTIDLHTLLSKKKITIINQTVTKM